MIGLNENEILTFFAVLVRYSVLIALIPILGEKAVPALVKILLALSISVALYPALVTRGWIRPSDAAQWGTTVGGLVRVFGLEVMVGLILGFISRLVFDAVSMAGDIAGTAMGLASANLYDPQQDSQSQLLSRIQGTLALMLFLALDGHHLVLRAVLTSYRWIGLGELHFDGNMAQGWLRYTGQLFRMALQLAAPIAIVLFVVNIFYAVMAKAIPQLNILVLSMSISGMLGLFVLLLSMPGFFDATRDWFSQMGDDLVQWMKWMGHG